MDEPRDEQDYANFLAYIRDSGYRVTERGTVEECFSTYCLDDSLEDGLEPDDLEGVQFANDPLFDSIMAKCDALADKASQETQVSIDSVEQDAHVELADTEQRVDSLKGFHMRDLNRPTIMGVHLDTFDDSVSAASNTDRNNIITNLALDALLKCDAERCLDVPESEIPRYLRTASETTRHVEVRIDTRGVVDGVYSAKHVDLWTSRADKSLTAGYKIRLYNDGVRDVVHKLELMGGRNLQRPTELASLTAAVVAMLEQGFWTARDKQEISSPYPVLRDPFDDLLAPCLLPWVVGDDSARGALANQQLSGMKMTVTCTHAGKPPVQYMRPAADINGGLLSTYLLATGEVIGHGLQIVTGLGGYEHVFAKPVGTVRRSAYPRTRDVSPAIQQSLANSLTGDSGVFATVGDGVRGFAVRTIIAERTAKVRRPVVVEVLNVSQAARQVVGLVQRMGGEARQYYVDDDVQIDVYGQALVQLRRSIKPVGEGSFIVRMGQLPASLKLPARCDYMTPAMLLAELSELNSIDCGLEAGVASRYALDAAAYSTGDGKVSVYFRTAELNSKVAAVELSGGGTRGLGKLTPMLSGLAGQGVSVRWLSRTLASEAAAGGALVTSAALNQPTVGYRASPAALFHNHRLPSLGSYTTLDKVIDAAKDLVTKRYDASKASASSLRYRRLVDLAHSRKRDSAVPLHR